MASNPLIVDVANMLDNYGAVRELRFSASPDDLGSDMVKVIEPLDFALRLESIADGIVVQGTIDGHYETTCRRCLEPSRAELHLDVTEIYRRPEDEPWEEGYQVEGTTMNLEPLVRDDVGLELPMFPLCREDCKGLCPTCGKNLNDGPCDCPPESADERWAVLRQLLDDSDGT